MPRPGTREDRPMAKVSLHLSGDPQADAVISKEPLALLIGMVLDQQIPIEKAFSSPAVLSHRLGGKLDARSIAGMDPDVLAAAFTERPALHRFPGAMAARVQSLCQILVDEYGGKADAVWRRADSGADLVARLKALPGFGEQKARIFGALLGKQLGVRPDGWQKATSPFGGNGTYLSVADITDSAALAKVREHKKAMKAAARAET